MATDEPTRCCLCDDDAVAIYYLPRGCAARPGLTVQPLCAQHEGKMTPIGARVELLKDLRITPRGEATMDDAGAIGAVKDGRRAVTDTSIKDREDEALSATCAHSWRTIACDFETDVIECGRCGKQGTCACDFDDEFD